MRRNRSWEQVGWKEQVEGIRNKLLGRNRSVGIMNRSVGRNRSWESKIDDCLV